MVGVAVLCLAELGPRPVPRSNIGCRPPRCALYRYLFRVLTWQLILVSGPRRHGMLGTYLRKLDGDSNSRFASYFNLAISIFDNLGSRKLKHGYCLSCLQSVSNSITQPVIKLAIIRHRQSFRVHIHSCARS